MPFLSRARAAHLRFFRFRDVAASAVHWLVYHLQRQFGGARRGLMIVVI